MSIAESTEKNERPWGRYDILAESPDCKIKRILVRPGARTSLQRHARRHEHWFVLSGEARVTLDETDFFLKPLMSINIPLGAVHRIANPGKTDLEFVEIQTGDYFGEDDIERLEDDYGRKGSTAPR